MTCHRESQRQDNRRFRIKGLWELKVLLYIYYEPYNYSLYFLGKTKEELLSMTVYTLPVIGMWSQYNFKEIFFPRKLSEESVSAYLIKVFFSRNCVWLRY